jgi:hypothetical protein
MATVQALVSTQVTDALGVTATVDQFVTFPDTLTAADLQTWSNAYILKLDPITDGQITLQKISLVMALPGSGIKTSPNATAEVERTGLLNMSQTGSRYKFGVDIPAIAEAVISNGKINLTNSDVQAFIGIMTTVTNSVTVVSKFLNALRGLVDALLTFRKHRKALNRRSFEPGG